MKEQNNLFPRRILSAIAILLTALLLLSACPVTAFASSSVPSTTRVATATVYCQRYSSCQGKHTIENCPGPQRLTNTSSRTTVGNVAYTVAAAKPTTTSATTVTVTAPNKATYTYTVSADNKTITERRNGAVTRTVNVSDYVDANAPARTTKSKKDGKFSYQKVGTNEAQMKIWKDNGAKTTITRTKANTEAYFAYQAAIDNNIKAFNRVVGCGVAAVLVGVATVAATIATAGLSGAAAAAIAAKVAAGIIATGSIVESTVISVFVASFDSISTTYQDAKTYYYILKG